MKKFQNLAASCAAALALVALGWAADAPRAPSPKAPAAAKPAAGPKTPAGSVATVNGVPISSVECDRAMRGLSAVLARPEGGGHASAALPRDAVKAEAIRQLVNRELLYQESLKYPVKDLKKKADEQIQKMKTQMQGQDMFQKMLKMNGLTEKELKDLIAKQISTEHYLQTQIEPTVKKATDKDAGDFYNKNKDKFVAPDQVRASHILIQIAPSATAPEKDKALAKAKDLQKRAARGEDFAKLARENSQDRGSSQQGGDLGFFAKSQMVPAFADAAFALKAGQVSNVVQTQFGYHVIKATGRKPPTQQAVQEAKGRILQYLNARALDEAVEKKLEALRKTAKITVASR